MNEDPVPASGSISIPHYRGLALRENSLVARGLQDIAQLGKPRAEEFFDRAATFFKNGDYDKAIAYYTEAIRLNPKDAKAYNNRGLAYDNKGDPDSAIADYIEAIRLNPKNAKVYYNRGLTYSKKGDRGKAKLDFDQAQRLGFKPQEGGRGDITDIR